MKYLAAIVFTIFAVPAWAVNKCVDAAGKVSYQNEPCPQQSEKVKLHNTAPSTEPERPIDAMFKDLKRANDDYIKSLKAAGVACGPKLERMPDIGMSEADFLCTRPGMYGVNKVNQTVTAGGVRKQYVIDHSAIRYVYVDNGVVTAIQK
ncbi:MAG: DUF4124 domain-containing protein [Acidovorax sp.]